MQNSERETLERQNLAPYIQKATALIGKSRRVGGNQFRHAMATFAILLDYKVTDPILLKASLLHDLLEDIPETDVACIASLDDDGPAVVALVMEVTRSADEPKSVFLARLRDRGSDAARRLKVADRISNMTDLHESVLGRDFVMRYVAETIDYVLPMAHRIDANMASEIEHLLSERDRQLSAA